LQSKGGLSINSFCEFGLHRIDIERGQVPLSDPLSEVLRPKFGLWPDLSQNLTWRRRFGQTGLKSRNLLRPNLSWTWKRFAQW